VVEPSFDHSTFTRNRERLLDAHVSRQFFDEVVIQADGLNLLSDEHWRHCVAGGPCPGRSASNRNNAHWTWRSPARLNRIV
jgi:hypothetical protein